MKNNKLLLFLNFISLIITGLFYFMTFTFNPKFTTLRSILYVKDFKEAGGFALLITILVLLTVFTILYIIYILIDNKTLEVFHQSGYPEYYPKKNLLSINRLFQYYTLLTAFTLIIRDGWRAFTFDPSTQSMYIFKTDVLFVMWDVVFWLFFAMSITLIFEWIYNKKAIE